jgi:hypothetical protein
MQLISYILIFLFVCDMPFWPTNLRGRFCNSPVDKNEVSKIKCGSWWRKEIGNEVPLFIFRYFISYILIHYVSQSVYDRGFGGWGRDRPVKQRATGVSLWRGLDHHGFRVQTVSTKHCNRPKGRNDGWIASLSHRTRGGYKNLPLPPLAPHYQKNRRLYRGACFRKFPKLSRTKVQNVRTGVLGFLTLGKGVNTWIDNLRVHTAGSDTRTTLVGTTVRSGWLEWRSHGCLKVTGTISINSLRLSMC